MERLEFENALDKYVNYLENCGWSKEQSRKYVKRIIIEFFKDLE